MIAVRQPPETEFGLQDSVDLFVLYIFNQFIHGKKTLDNQTGGG